MQIIEDYYARFNQGDSEGMLELLSEAVVHEISQGPVQRGKEAFRSFLHHMNDCYRERVSDLCVLSQPGRAAAEFWLDGEYLATDPGLPEARGQKYRLRVATFFKLEGESISRVSVHYNLLDWLEQIGG